ncbi:MAG TPA: phasin family protein [Rhodothermales bacterium]|nr:phasin family protein [Rhodothermales bacterium]
MKPTPNTLDLNKLATELVDKSRDFYFAGLGAFAVAQEEGNKMFDMFAEKGKEVADYMQALQRRTMNLDEEAQDLMKEGEAYADKLIDKGESLQEEALAEIKKWMDDLQVQATKWQKEATKLILNPVEKMISPVQDVVTDALTRFGVPTSGEVRTLNAQVTELTQKVDQLTALLAAKEVPAPKKTAKTAKIEDVNVEVVA